MFERLKYWWAEKPFKYLARNAKGYKVLAYNPFTDKLSIRTSYCGMVDGYTIMTRKEFEAIK